MLVTGYKNKNFLIIDSIKPSHDILKKFAMSLSEEPVDSTLYAQDVVPMCLEKAYDVILLGYDLGDKQKNGQQLLEELRVSELVSRHCVVIIVTAEVSQAMVLAALEHKPDSYLCKPYSLHELHSRLRKCINKKKAMANIYQALDAGNRTQTIELVDEALQYNTPYYTECLGIKSRQLFELQLYDQAEIIYQSCHNVENCQWATIGLGKIAIENNDLGQAITIFQDFIIKQPLYLPTYDLLASTYIMQAEQLEAQQTLESALKISPFSIVRLKKYAYLCFDNTFYEKAGYAFQNANRLAVNTIHQSPDTALMFARSLTEYTASLPSFEAKKLHNTALTMLGEMYRSYRDITLKIQGQLLSACLFENINEKVLARDKLDQALTLYDQEKKNITVPSLKGIASLFTKLNLHSQASQLLEMLTQSSSEEQLVPEGNEIELATVSHDHKQQARKALAYGKKLFKAERYIAAITAFNEALLLFPNHTSIKLNLLQVLLVSYEIDEGQVDHLSQAKKITIELLTITKENSEYNRYIKMKKKYQQLAGI